ncbi:MAG: hypothetical protein JO327_12445 [Nitrososphaeraceae archaeon]|nr:hypothetical protein [Nitrososphaeraceae archaeon]
MTPTCYIVLKEHRPFSYQLVLTPAALLQIQPPAGGGDSGSGDHGGSGDSGGGDHGRGSDSGGGGGGDSGNSGN